MKQTVLSSLFIAISTSLYAQVGIGLTEPKAFLNVQQGRTVLFGADTAGVESPIRSTKMIWYGNIGAFRAGAISNSATTYTNWDKANVGWYSFASGFDTKANGDYSTAIGFNTQASGEVSTAMGSNAQASGGYSTAMGYYTRASGEYSTAIGINSYASGDQSTAMGTAVRADHRGSFIIGDDGNILGSTYSTTANNQMMMHFSGGYVLYTSATRQDNFPSGIELQPNANAWSVISDSTRKENFRGVDGAQFLKKISGMRLGSWNYKGQNVKQYRHYGPMAQDFFAAFGHDELGVIGENKSINQADFDGVNLIAIQALIKEVEALKAENRNLKQAETSMRAETESLKIKMEQFEKQLSTIMASSNISTISK